MAGGCPANATAFRGGCSGPFCISHISNLSEPMFWLHHGMVDKVWFDWQQKSAANAKAFGGRAIGGQVPTVRAD
jgi:tyrosinase